MKKTQSAAPALIALKIRAPRPANVRTIPMWVPAVGAGVALGLLLAQVGLSS